MTLTFCIDFGGDKDTKFAGWKPGWHRAYDIEGRLRSIRIYWMWFAIAWYRFDDYKLVTQSMGWSTNPKETIYH